MTFILENLRGTPAYAELTAKCRVYSVMISPNPDLEGGGSGTLVRYKNLCGILSATHVMACDIDAPYIFSPLSKTIDPTLFYTVPVPLQDLIYLETPEGITALKGKKPWHKGTLDICLLHIDPQRFNALLQMSGKQAVDLYEYKTKYAIQRDYYTAIGQPTPWSWAVDGAPREEAKHDDHRVLQSRFDGLYVCGGSKNGGTYKTDPLTLVNAPFDQDADRIQHDMEPSIDAVPNGFEGISGGGMWQVSFKGENGIPEAVAEMFFSGVCVAEDPRKCLYSRGPSALYDIFTAYLDTLA